MGEAELDEYYSIPNFQPPELATPENFPRLLEELKESTAAARKDGSIISRRIPNHCAGDDLKFDCGDAIRSLARALAWFVMRSPSQNAWLIEPNA